MNQMLISRIGDRCSSNLINILTLLSWVETALAKASENGHEKVVNLLLTNSADVDLKD